MYKSAPDKYDNSWQSEITNFSIKTCPVSSDGCFFFFFFPFSVLKLALVPQPFANQVCFVRTVATR